MACNGFYRSEHDKAMRGERAGLFHVGNRGKTGSKGSACRKRVGHRGVSDDLGNIVNGYINNNVNYAFQS